MGRSSRERLLQVKRLQQLCTLYNIEPLRLLPQMDPVPPGDIKKKQLVFGV